jgi:UPF0042 nucleotide-binding protein
MSGSGKRTAFKAFEDLGYFCVDNLPTALIPRLIQMTIASGGKIDKLALVVDVRLGEALADFRRLLPQLRQMPLVSKLIFFEASDPVLARRYSETRRVHPLARESSLWDGFRLEREQLSDVKTMADMVVDTTDLSVHDLRDLIYDRFRSQTAREDLNISVVSFGFKRGLPYNADLVFDVRFLPNPNFVSHLKEKDGTSSDIVEYLKGFAETEETIEKFQDMLEYLLPRYRREGKSYCTLAVGCTGGRHRSVMVAEELARRLRTGGLRVNLIHRDLHQV